MLHALSGGELILYSPTLQVMNEIHLGKEMTSSVWRDYIFLQERRSSQDKDKKFHPVSLLDADTLEPIRSWSADFPVSAFSRRYFAWWDESNNTYRRSLYPPCQHL